MSEPKHPSFVSYKYVISNVPAPCVVGEKMPELISIVGELYIPFPPTGIAVVSISNDVASSHTV